MRTQQHKGIYGVLVQDGKILLVHKAKGPYKGLLDLPGGTPELDEKPEETLSRELIEETGVKVLEQTPFFQAQKTLSFTDSEGEEVQFSHFAEIYRVLDFDLSSFNSKIQELDVEGASWVDLQSLSPGACSWLVWDAVGNYLEH